MSILWDMDGPLLDIQTALEMTKKNSDYVGCRNVIE